MPESVSKAVDDTIKAIIKAERELDEQTEKLRVMNPDVFATLDAIDAQREMIVGMKEEVKQALIKVEDFDLHKVDGLKVSVCPVVKLAVGEIDQIDNKFKKTEVVVDTKKAGEHKKLYGEVPAGFVDKTHYRFTWQEDKHA